MEDKSQPRLTTSERATLGAALLVFLVVLAFAANNGSNHSIVITEIVATVVLVIGVALGWIRHSRGTNPPAVDDEQQSLTDQPSGRRWEATDHS
jgi:positive regulator of sigma E activity